MWTITRLVALIGSALVVLLSTSLGCPDATQVGEQCVASDVIGQCPVGSDPVLGAEAEASCGGSFDLKLIEESGSATGQCQSSGSCEILCQYQTPCSCGVAELSRDKIICAECAAQSCGDGRCEGTERPFCDPGREGCFPCIEDCGGATCGDGDCTGDESPELCPQDCARGCTPNETACLGTILMKCAADGSQWVDFDCAGAGLLCSAGKCVQPGACGNGLCEAGEDATGCPQDCGTVCVPNSARCQGNTLVSCNADGSATSDTDCAAQGLICNGNACVMPDVCGNRLCEQGEDATCPQDCAATCGNDICENGEEDACPKDCEDCGDGVCGSGEQVSCPQDCGICIPSEKLCLGEILRVCNANGSAFDDINCVVFDQKCAAGSCVVPGICGNGACEAGENGVCNEDCAEVCGNNRCAGGETFDTCARDCDPVCGDGRCQGIESTASCAVDCIAGCGDAVCQGVENRDNCPRDCGFCGDGTCDDGAESPSLFPPSNLVSCPEDCVQSGCDADGDCNDGIACTTGVCVAKICSYTPVDALCAAGDKCIKFSGCCQDADRDGFADLACGGSDCDDDDATVFPGAFEPCGGGDKNCNGSHKPSLAPPRQVTQTSSFKSGLQVVQLPDGYAATWAGTPVDKRRIEYAMLAPDGTLVGNVRQLTGIEAEVDGANRSPFIAYSPTSNRIGLAWVSPIAEYGNQSYFATVSATTAQLVGDIVALPTTRCIINSVSYSFYFTATGLAWLDNQFIVSNTADNCGGANILGWVAISEAGGLTMPWGQTIGMSNAELVVAGDRVVTFRNPATAVREIYSVSPSDPAAGGSLVSLTPESAAGTCVLGWDGEQLAHACWYRGELHFNRIAWNGSATLKTAITEQPMTPVHIASAPAGLGAGDTAKVGILALQDTANLYLTVVERVDGQVVLEPGIIAGGVNINSPRLMFADGNFQAFWIADKGDTEQIFSQTITCE